MKGQLLFLPRARIIISDIMETYALMETWLKVIHNIIKYKECFGCYSLSIMHLSKKKFFSSWILLFFKNIFNIICSYLLFIKEKKKY